MSEINNDRPVVVTGEERKHPAIRQLARACIEFARLRLEQKVAEQSANRKRSEPAEGVTPEQEGREDA
jgi:hypothetical protein